MTWEWPFRTREGRALAWPGPWLGARSTPPLDARRRALLPCLTSGTQGRGGREADAGPWRVQGL